MVGCLAHRLSLLKEPFLGNGQKKNDHAMMHAVQQIWPNAPGHRQVEPPASKLRVKRNSKMRIILFLTS
jgi:hypothetical protein